MPYDVFISYRRETGADDARLLQQALKARGYSVFFDYDSLRDGKFDEKIFEAIDEATVFVLMLTERALDRCVDADDWVSLEIERAIAKGKKIISVAPSDQKWRFPENLPDSLRTVKTEQASELNKASLFEVSIDKMIEERFPDDMRRKRKPSTESLKKQPEGSFVVCPICGKKNRVEGTFRCRECGRDNLCLRHQDEETYFCCECKASVRVNSVVASRKKISGDAHKKVQLWENGPYWAETNIGADHPWEPGYYFWWGDIVGYKREKLIVSGVPNHMLPLNNEVWAASDWSSSGFSFSDDDVPTNGKDISSLRKEGWIAENDVLVPKHDAAHVQWGGSWRMPSDQELQGLHCMCDWIWTTMNGVNGYVVRGRGDYFSSSIFLPTAGDGYGTSLNHAGSDGYYWSSVSCSDDHGSWCLYFFANTEYGVDMNYRSYGLSVRPVQGFADVSSSPDVKFLK